jgi:putative transposase
MKFRFISEQRGTHGVGKVARILRVSRGGYYAWRVRPQSERERVDGELVEKIRSIQKRVKGRYGSPKVTVELKRSGYRVGHNRVARLMRENGLGARLKRRSRSTTDSKHSLPVARDLLKRDFEVPRADNTWLSDLSYIPTAEGWLYLCSIIDLYSRKVVGWSLSTRIRTEPVLKALMMALMRRRPARGLIFHSDRGFQYCSHAFGERAGLYGIRQSMSRKADPWDNAPMESFFKTLKSELCGGKAFGSREEARTAIFEYIEVFYNRMRLHSSLGYLSPVEYEQVRGRKVA